MKSLTHQFADWVRTKPAKEGYDWGSSENCALGQFLTAHGIPLSRYDSFDLGWRVAVLLQRPWTFGALAERLAHTQGPSL